jgi:hypothetical protein
MDVCICIYVFICMCMYVCLYVFHILLLLLRLFTFLQFMHFFVRPQIQTFRSLSPCTCSLPLCCSEHEASHLFNFPEAPPFPLPPQNKVLFIYIPVSLTLWETSGAFAWRSSVSPVCCVLCCPHAQL